MSALHSIARTRPARHPSPPTLGPPSSALLADRMAVAFHRMHVDPVHLPFTESDWMRSQLNRETLDALRAGRSWLVNVVNAGSHRLKSHQRIGAYFEVIRWARETFTTASYLSVTAART